MLGFNNDQFSQPLDIKQPSKPFMRNVNFNIFFLFFSDNPRNVKFLRDVGRRYSQNDGDAQWLQLSVIWRVVSSRRCAQKQMLTGHVLLDFQRLPHGRLKTEMRTRKQKSRLEYFNYNCDENTKINSMAPAVLHKQGRNVLYLFTTSVTSSSLAMASE